MNKHNRIIQYVRMYVIIGRVLLAGGVCLSRRKKNARRLELEISSMRLHLSFSIKPISKFDICFCVHQMFYILVSYTRLFTFGARALQIYSVNVRTLISIFVVVCKAFTFISLHAEIKSNLSIDSIA